MKNNLKTKVMLAVLAGGMLCANGAYASYGVSCWYGKTGDKWTSSSSSAASSDLTLNIDNNTKNDEGTIKVNVDYVTDYICGGYSVQSSGAVTNNTITFETTNEKIIIAEIYGGYSPNGTAGGDTHGLGNKVKIINGGTFNRNIIGGVGKSASGNEVTIEKGTFSAMNIYGGFATTGNATNNSVTIKGGTFSGGIGIYGGNSSSGNATNNTVTIEGGTFNSFQLYGGMVNAGTSSGNILNLKTKITDKAREVKYFQTMNFILPSNIAKDETMLSTEKMAFDATKTVINVDASAVTLNDDDIINLIVSDNVPTGVWEQGKITGADGTITLSGNNLIYTYSKSSGDTATTKAVAEGIAASLAFVNQGADMVATSGIDGLYVADSENPTIAAFSGNKTRYNTGSHVDIHGWNALAGVALNNKASFSHGVFVEIGNGDIDTYAALNGSGSSDYKGGGYMLRKDMGKGWTIDGAVRAGRVETGWSNNDKGGYEAKQTYYGAHVTFNKMLKEYGEQKLNGYLRYTFTHLGSDSVNLDGTHYGFDSVNSHRTRLGARMVDEGQNGFELYYGAAWEYGFGGDCDATVNGVTTSGPAVDGSNGVFEVGGTWSDKKWEISAGLEGYVGAKRGVAGGMNFIYKF